MRACSISVYLFDRYIVLDLQVAFQYFKLVLYFISVFDCKGRTVSSGGISERYKVFSIQTKLTTRSQYWHMFYILGKIFQVAMGKAAPWE